MALAPNPNIFKLCRGRTGIIYDDRMTQHKCEWDSDHVERPERYTKIIERCNQLNLIDRCENIKSRFGTLEEILLKHSEEHYLLLKSTSCATDFADLEQISSRFDGVYIHPSTFDLACLAVGSVIELVDNVVTNKIQNGMAIIRPPGHHAMKTEFNGFCLFNNVAIAAQNALNVHGLKRILIVDFDVHHGQATQRMFYDDPRVLYFSVHRFEFGTFWPNLRESDFHYVGEGNGKGFNLNIPLNKKGMTNGDYLAIWQQILIPVASEFQPELVIVSAGFDAAYGCPEGEMELTPACYAHLVSPLLQLAEGRVAVVLEGGYCLESLAESAAITLKTLLGDPCPLLEEIDEPSDCIRDTILNSVHVHKPYWKCFKTFREYDSKELNADSPQPDWHQVEQKFIGEIRLPLEKYPTRKCYPVHTPERLVEIAHRLKELRAAVDLSFPNNRVCYSFFDHEIIYGESAESRKLDKTLADLNLTGRIKKVTVHHKLEELELEWTRKWFQWQTNKDIAFYLNTPLFTETIFKVLDNVLSGDSRCGIGIITGEVRGPIEPNGYITSVATQIAIKTFELNKVLIIDWNTTRNAVSQSIFETNPRVVYVSINLCNTPELRLSYTIAGKDLGEGLTVNIPWSDDQKSYADLIVAIERIIMPIAYEFDPELVLMTGDLFAPQGNILAEDAPQAYTYLIHWLSALANGKLIILLESANNNVNFHTAAICTKALLGDPAPALKDRNFELSAANIENINNVLSVHEKYWKSLRFNKKLPSL